MKNKFKNKNKDKAGFTLVELLVSVALFTVITFFSLGALLSIYDANKKSQSSKTVVDNLNLSIENMTRNIRFGSNYYCGISDDTAASAECSNGGESISVTFNGSRIIYKLNSSNPNDRFIEKSEDGGANYNRITSNDTKIEYLKFYVFGAGNPAQQPYVIAVIKGYVGNKPTTKTTFSIETLMSQRTLNL